MKKLFQFNTILISILLLFFTTAVDLSSKHLQQLDSIGKDAAIIEFDMLKCGCCWGWIIKVENDTIKAYDLPDKSIMPISNKEELPIKVKIQVGKKLQRCTKDYPYYEIKFIERISNNVEK